MPNPRGHSQPLNEQGFEDNAMPLPLQDQIDQLLKAGYGVGHGHFSITPTDDTQLNNGDRDVVARAIFVGTGGDLVVRSVNDDGTMSDAETLKNIPDGTLVEGLVMSVQEATTADDLVGLL